MKIQENKQAFLAFALSFRKKEKIYNSIHKLPPLIEV